MSGFDLGCIVFLALLVVVLLAIFLSGRRKVAAPTSIPDDTQAWLSRNRAPPPPPPPPLPVPRSVLPSWLSGSGDYGLHAVGMSHYEPAFLQICGPRTADGVEQEEMAELVLDPANPYDRNAVRVEIRGLHVGYLAKADAVAFRQRLALEHIPGDRFPCKAEIVGGWEGGYYGVHMDVALYR